MTLSGKLLLQNLSTQKLDGDEKIPNEDATKWNRWIQDLSALMELQYLFLVFCSCRTVILTVQNQIKFITLAVLHQSLTQLQLICDSCVTMTMFFCHFIFGKASPSPIKTISIVRLELMAAVLAVKIDQMLQQD